MYVITFSVLGITASEFDVWPFDFIPASFIVSFRGIGFEGLFI